MPAPVQLRTGTGMRPAAIRGNAPPMGCCCRPTLGLGLSGGEIRRGCEPEGSNAHTHRSVVRRIGSFPHRFSATGRTHCATVRFLPALHSPRVEPPELLQLVDTLCLLTAGSTETIRLAWLIFTSRIAALWRDFYLECQKVLYLSQCKMLHSTPTPSMGLVQQ